MTASSSLKRVLVVGNRPISLSLIRHLWPLPGEGVVVCADGGINRLFSLNDNRLVPDFLTGDLDSADPSLVSHYSSLGTVVRKDSDQNENDLHKAISLGISALGGSKNPNIARNARSAAGNIVDVVGVTGGRLDHQLAVLNEAVRATKKGISIAIHSDEDTMAVLAPGSHRLKAKADALCGIATVCGPAEVKTAGLKWEVDGVLEMGSFISSSNRVLAETVEISTSNYLVWVVQVDREGGTSRK